MCKHQIEKIVEINVLIGETFTNIKVNTCTIEFFTDKYKYVMYPDEENSCNDVDVELEDITGNINDLIGAPIITATVTTDSYEDCRDEEYDESWTWTFYNIATQKGHVTLRWYGRSNGYYSEEVYIKKCVL